MSSPVDFDGWRARPPTKLTATTATNGGWGQAYADALAVLADPARAPQPNTVQALAIGGTLACAFLRNQIVDGEGGTLIARTDLIVNGGARPANNDPPDAPHESAAITLERSLETILIARCPAPRDAPPLPAAAILAPGGNIDAAAPFPWPQVIIILAVAGVASWAIHKASDVAEVWVQERARTDQLEKSHASAAELVRRHIDREREAGKSLPLDEATKAALSNLGAEQVATASRLTGRRSGGDDSTTALLIVAAAAGLAFALR